jgi:hypothetical protein
MFVRPAASLLLQFADLIPDCNVGTEKIAAKVTRSSRFAMTIDRRSTFWLQSRNATPGYFQLWPRHDDNGECSAADQDRNAGVGQYLVGRAAEQNR